MYLRAADELDVGSLAELRAASLIELGLLVEVARAAFVARAAGEFRALFRADRMAAWIACDRDVAVASSCAIFYDRLPYAEGARHAELCGVYVMPAYRKRGFASELVREVVAEAQASGARKIFLRPSSTAKSLYTRIGFVETELMVFAPSSHRVAPSQALAAVASASLPAGAHSGEPRLAASPSR